MINGILDYLSGAINNNYLLAPFLTLFAGIITSFTPCSLSSIPLIIGYTSTTKKNTFKTSISFCLGTAFTFIMLGIFASLFNTMFILAGDVWYVVLSIICILMVLQLWDVINIVPSLNLIGKYHKKGYAGAFVTGVLSGLFSSPCSTPVLIVLLTIVGTKNSMIYGIILLSYYAIGFSTLPLLCGFSTNYVKKIKKMDKYKKVNDILTFILGLLILLMSFYFFYIGI